MRIQRLKDGVLWIAAANDEEVREVIISGGTWSKAFVEDPGPAFSFDEIDATMSAINKDDTEAHWIYLGHRMGPFKHPDSEDYKCSNCGYEAYTILMDPPEVCPKCKARMVRGCDILL